MVLSVAGPLLLHTDSVFLWDQSREESSGLGAVSGIKSYSFSGNVHPGPLWEFSSNARLGNRERVSERERELQQEREYKAV